LQAEAIEEKIQINPDAFLHAALILPTLLSMKNEREPFIGLDGEPVSWVRVSWPGKRTFVYLQAEKVYIRWFAPTDEDDAPFQEREFSYGLQLNDFVQHLERLLSAYKEELPAAPVIIIKE
jgi:hypothetical protein